MINAMKEFIEHTGKRMVKCAHVYGDEYYQSDLNAKLCIGYNTYDLANFLNALRFNYKNGFGGQFLFGTIWYEDGTWSERGEYDGSEWWEHRSCPAIPEDLKLDGRS